MKLELRVMNIFTDEYFCYQHFCNINSHWQKATKSDVKLDKVIVSIIINVFLTHRIVSLELFLSL